MESDLYKELHCVRCMLLIVYFVASHRLLWNCDYTHTYIRSCFDTLVKTAKSCINTYDGASGIWSV